MRFQRTRRQMTIGQKRLDWIELGRGVAVVVSHGAYVGVPNPRYPLVDLGYGVLPSFLFSAAAPFKQFSTAMRRAALSSAIISAFRPSDNDRLK